MRSSASEEDSGGFVKRMILFLQVPLSRYNSMEKNIHLRMSAKCFSYEDENLITKEIVS